MKYEKCLTCSDLGAACDGPNFLAMDTVEMGHWCNEKRKQIPGMTYDKVAAETGISKSAVFGFLNGTHSDYRIETIRPIVKLIIGGKWDDNACGNLSNSEKAQYESQILQYQQKIETYEKNIAFLKDQVSFKENQMHEKDKLLAERGIFIAERGAFMKRKDRIIAILAVLLGITLAVIITMLIIDAMSPDVGFFWRAQ